MNSIKVSDTKDYFIKDGKPFFYFADTVWSAFYNVPLEEWEEYLDYRKTQGFNVLQIIVLPIKHDASESNISIDPFRVKEDGNYYYSEINEDYFGRACKMLDMAVERGFVPALAPLWFPYVISSDNPDSVMPLNMVKTYITYIVKTFAKYNPIYIVTGDTWFEKEEFGHYWREIETIKALSPDSLTAIHLNPHVNIPEEFLDSPLVDIVLYQSGHGVDNGIETQKLPYKFAQYYYSKSVKRPIVNGEPCYEGAGYAYTYGRFKEFDVRKAIWQSLLSGAKAGITYGAHGIWSWHKKGSYFSNIEFIETPFDWRTALRFKGAWDTAYARWIFETYGLFDLEPENCILNKTEEIRMSITKGKDKIAIYVPFNTNIELNMDISGYDFVMFDLENKLLARPEIGSKDGRSTMKMHDFNSDVLIIGIKM
jgi:hypothetical protein